MTFIPPFMIALARNSVGSQQYSHIVAPVAEKSEKLQQARTELQTYLRFQKGWDGYTGKPFTRHIISEASKLAGRFSRVLGERLDELIPGPASDGSIDLEFRVGSKSLFVTMYEGQDQMYVLVDGDDIERTNGPADNTTIKRLCSRLISGLPSV